MYAGYYVAELLGELTDDYDPHPELFDLADETLVALSAGEPVSRRLLRFEMLALRTLGHLPSLETCVDCGARVPLSGRVAFGELDGGVLCAGCRVGKRQVASVSAGALRVMVQFAEPQGQTWRRTEIDLRLGGEIRGVLSRYMCNLLGHKPRMHEYLGLLSS